MVSIRRYARDWRTRFAGRGLVLGVLLVSMVFWNNSKVPGAEKGNALEREKNKEKKQAKDKNPSAPIVPEYAASAHAPAAQKRSDKTGSANNPVHIKDPDLGKWTKWLVFWTCALVFTSIISAIITYCQLVEIQKAGSQTDRTITVLNRQADSLSDQVAQMKAQKGLTRVQLSANVRSEDISHEPAYSNGQLTGWMINPHFRNVGATDARQYREWWGAVSVRERSDPHNQCPALHQSPVSGQPHVISADNSSVMAGWLLTVQEATDAINGLIKIYFIGHADYRDVFPDTPHHK
jgi:hypothetical protein